MMRRKQFLLAAPLWGALLGALSKCLDFPILAGVPVCRDGWLGLLLEATGLLLVSGYPLDSAGCRREVLWGSHPGCRRLSAGARRDEARRS